MSCPELALSWREKKTTTLMFCNNLYVLFKIQGFENVANL